jgi:hypothetical protein
LPDGGNQCHHGHRYKHDELVEGESPAAGLLRDRG